MNDPAHPTNCPSCGSERVARIVYGFVDFLPLEGELALGGAVLGGCDVSETSHQWHCGSCGKEWGVTELASGLAELRVKSEAVLAQRDAEAQARGTLEAVLHSSGLARCPHCRRSFDTNATLSWDGKRHKTCGTYLRLTPSEQDA